MFQWRAVNSQEHPLLKPRSLPCKIDWLYQIWFRNSFLLCIVRGALGIFHLTEFWCQMNFYSASRNLLWRLGDRTEFLEHPIFLFFCMRAASQCGKKGRQNDQYKFKEFCSVTPILVEPLSRLTISVIWGANLIKYIWIANKVGMIYNRTCLMY